MSRRSTLSTLSMAAVVGLCTLASGCADDAPSGPDAAPEPSALLTAAGLAGLDSAVMDAIGNNVRGDRYITEVTDFSGVPGAAQIASLSRRLGDFPTEGGSYLVVSSGNAAAPDARATSHTRFGACDDGRRCDAGGVDLELAIPAGARWLTLDLRYFSWDGHPHTDPFRIYAVHVVETENGPETRTDLLREYTTVTELYGGGSYDFALGRLRSEEFDLRPYRGRTITLRFEASDDGGGYGDQGLDSGALIDNLRIVNAAYDDWSGPVTTATIATPSPVAINAEFRVTSLVTDKGADATRIRAAEYSLDGGPWTPMLLGGRTDFAATARVVHPGVAVAGVYEICVRGQDANGNVGQPECIEQAIYDPSESTYAVGAGWVDALQGSFAQDWSINGRTDFAFNVSYRPRVDPAKPLLLKGEMAFHFADEQGRTTLRFASTELTYMVSQGGLLRIGGKGRLLRDDVLMRAGRAAVHSFLISGVDANGRRSGAGDRLRLKVWNGATGEVVFDTQLGETNPQDAAGLADTAQPYTWVLGGGLLLK